MLPDGRRLHLQDGPIDLVVEAFGSPAAVAHAHAVAARSLDGLLDDLCRELALLRSATHPAHVPAGGCARAMHAATLPHAVDAFITPMAAVAGAVADTILAAIRAAADLDRAYVNNGGDIAVHCAAGHRFTAGMVDRPDRPNLFGRVVLDGGDGVGGIATSGWRGRSFSLGIADSVTVVAACAAAADAAATVIANAVDLVDHPGVHRAPADTIQVDSDLGRRLVTRGVDPLSPGDRARALHKGLSRAQALHDRGLIAGAALHLQGETVTLGAGLEARTRLSPPVPTGRPAARDGLRPPFLPLPETHVHA